MSENNIIINIITYFPGIHIEYFKYSFFKKLQELNKININIFNILKYSKDNNLKIDDKIYGGGYGMVMKFDFFSKFIKFHNLDKVNKIIHPSPSGKLLNQEIIKKLFTNKTYTFLCSRYEGIDYRCIEKFNIEEISIGDYILYDGDTAALVIINSLIRNLFVKNEAKILESFSESMFGLLEYNQYTRPKIYDKIEVPEILTKGNHKIINEWKLKNSIEKTKKNRLDIYKNYKNKF